MAANQQERLRYCDILHNVLSGKGSLASYLNGQTRTEQDLNFPLLQEFCFGVCRWYFKLDSWAQLLLDKPLRKKDHDVYLLILLGLYQLNYMRTPAHAAVNETVNAVQALKKDWAKNLVNAVLRQAQRRLEELEALAEKNYSHKYAHPEWLLQRIKKDWPDCYRDILDANNQRAPMTLRVNYQQTTRDDYLALLQNAGIEAKPGTLANSSIILEQAVDVSQLPEFAAGMVSIQDEVSQLLPELLSLKSGMSVLDACAAPGGKTCALLESYPDLDVLCLDNDSKRLPRLQDNLRRCDLYAEVLCGDICSTGGPEYGPFDLILLDVPCSATGVIRRHPDIKLLRSPSELDALHAKQRALLDAAWPLLNNGGQLMYSTCSVLHSENSDQIAAFADRCEQRKEPLSILPLTHPAARNNSFGMNLLPGTEENDGFYYALLQKC